MSRHEHHLRIPDDQGGSFLAPENHSLWIDCSIDANGRPCYEQQRGSSKVNPLEATVVVEALLRLNRALRERGYGVTRQALATGTGPIRSWVEGQLGNAPAETVDDVFARGRVRPNDRAARPDEIASANDRLDLDARKAVGVITFYGAQVREIRNRIREARDGAPDALSALDLDSDTVDRYQGRERAIVLVSLVRARPCLRGGEHVKEYRRVNVALSRAQELLIIVGSVRTFRDIEVELPPLAGGPPRKVPVYRNIHEIVTRYGGRRYARQLLG